MEAPFPSQQTTLLILLGASAWPLFSEFQDSEAFANAAKEIKAFFLDPKRFGVSPENVLDVFNSNSSSDELDAQIGWFLERRLAALKATGHTARDLLVYFVGHGGFVGRDSDFYLAIRRTRMENPRASGIPMLSLADTLVEKARYLRRFIILDCCFAAAAFSAFQTGPAQVAIEKVVDAFEVRQRKVGFPAKGTALLCSSSQKSPSLLLPDGSSTMFTKALLDALSEGLPSQRERLSLREMKDIAADLLSETRNAPRPLVLSPDQSEGDVADIPFFPNLWIEKERARLAEEERARKSREERAHLAEEERVRKAEEEQARLAREERQRQALEPTSQLPHTTNAMPPLPSAKPPAELITLPSVQSSNTAASQVDRPIHMIQQRRLSTRWTILLSGLTLIIVLILVISLVGLYGRRPVSTPTPTPQLNPTTVSRLVKKWSFQAGTGVTVEGPCCTVNSSPTVVNGVVYVGSGDRHLYAFALPKTSS